MKAKDFMTENPTYVDADDSIWDALNAMLHSDIRHLPVVRSDEVIGVISDRDIRSFELPRDEQSKDPGLAVERLDAAVAELVQAELVSVEPDTDLSDVIDVLITEKVGAIPVVQADSGKLEGIISYVDVLSIMQDSIKAGKLSI